MRGKRKFLKVLVVMLLMFSISAMPVCAGGEYTSYSVSPRFSNISGASLSIGFSTSNVVYITLSADPYSHGSGVSGLIKLFDSEGTCLEVWSVSDYEQPIFAEVSYQGEYGETYTATFGGYAYSNNGTPADRLDLTATGTCKD